MSATKSRTSKQGKDQQVISGIQKDLQTMSSLPVGGETFTPTTLAALFQSRIDAANAIVTGKASWLATVKVYQALDARLDVITQDLKRLVIGAFGEASPKLADFGFTARKAVVRTPEQRAAAAAKARATRKARGTKGPKARLAITGTVSPTAPATAASPAAAPVAPQVAPAAAPTVTVNVTSAAGTPPVASVAPALEPAPAPAPVVVAVPAATPAQTPAKAWSSARSRQHEALTPGSK